MTEKEKHALSFQKARIAKLKKDKSYVSILEDWDLLYAKFSYKTELNPQEVREFVLLTKYLMKYGHSESIKFRCQQIYNTYMDNID